MSALPQPSSSYSNSISIEDFEQGDIDPDQFDHEAHVFVGWSYLQQYEPEDSIARFSEALRRLTKKLGNEWKYHETITWFFMILIAERRAKLESHDWHTFKRRNADLFATQPTIINALFR